MSNPHQARAVMLLTHYFRLVGEKAGLKWTSDHDMEIEQAVEAIVEAVREDTKRLIEEARPDAVVVQGTPAPLSGLLKALNAKKKKRK